MENGAAENEDKSQKIEYKLSKEVRNQIEIDQQNSFNYKLIDIKQFDNNNLEFIGNKLSDFEEVAKLNEKNEIKRKYTILGKGNFGFAEKMKSKKDNIYYAIKKLDKQQIDSDKIERLHFKREIEIMQKLNHQNIIKFFGYFEDKEDINNKK